MLIDEQWPVARLIPISSASGVEAQERRAASALLAVIGAVPEFGHALLRPLGAHKGRIQTFIEIPFKVGGKPIRPDGIITVTRGTRTWGAIIETKVGTAMLEASQIEAYLDLAKELGFDAVLSISNHYVTTSSDYPIQIDKRKQKKTALQHWSWVSVLTEAVVQKEHRGVSDPDQAYILNELIRYMSDPRSGVLTFEGMGPSWTKVRDGAREQTLRKADPEVAAVAARWDDLIRYLGLELTKVLGRDVKQLLPKEERATGARLNALKEALAARSILHAELQIPDTSGSLRVIADLRARQVSVSTRLDAPREGRSKGRVSWLLRHLQQAPDGLRIEAAASRAETKADLLGMVRENPEVLYPDQGKDLKYFVLTMTRNMGLKRDASKGSFADSIMTTAEEFYSEVLQNLRAWKASPPKLKREAEEAKEAPEIPRELEQPVTAAEAEMETEVARESGSAPDR
jgi:hypothetical protein